MVEGEDRNTTGMGGRQQKSREMGRDPLTFLTVFCKAGGEERQEQRKEGKSEKT